MSEATAQRVDEEVHELVMRGYETARQIIAKNRNAVRAMAAPTSLDPGELFELTGGNPFYVSEVLANPCDVVPPTVVAVPGPAGPQGAAGRGDLVRTVAAADLVAEDAADRGPGGGGGRRGTCRSRRASD